MLINCVVLLITVGVVVCENLTISSPNINDACSDDCTGSDPFYWCQEKRANGEGNVVRCVVQTVNGWNCLGGCEKKGEDYYWCMINPVKISVYKWWDFCSPDGYTTISNQGCVDECQRREKDYYYCHNSKEEKSMWDNCSPKGLVRPVQYTVNGKLCTSACEKRDKDYYWCNKVIDYCTTGGEGSCDFRWDYCSIDEYTTRSGERCKDRCDKKGEDYYWCNLTESKWDYCSPSPRLGVYVNPSVELTIYGHKCITPCRLSGDY